MTYTNSRNQSTIEDIIRQEYPKYQPGNYNIVVHDANYDNDKHKDRPRMSIHEAMILVETTNKQQRNRITNKDIIKTTNKDIMTTVGNVDVQRQDN